MIHTGWAIEEVKARQELWIAEHTDGISKRCRCGRCQKKISPVLGAKRSDRLPKRRIFVDNRELRLAKPLGGNRHGDTNGEASMLEKYTVPTEGGRFKIPD